MNSISVRLLLAAAVLMAIFIGVTTLVIQHTVDGRAELAQQERMQGQIYALLGVTEIGDDGQIDINATDLPNGLMRQPASGIYAEVRDATKQVWHSPSLTTPVPSSTDGAIGEWMFSKEADPALGPLFIIRFAVEWLLPSGTTTAYQFIVANSSEEYSQQRELFNRNLWIAMLSMGALLLLSIALVLAWGLSPLRRLSRQLNEIESGTRESLPVDVPVELNPLAGSINMLIASERSRQTRYRQTLDDLAHSLKTPLSVLRNTGRDTAQITAKNPTGKTELMRQADRMEQIISYHTKRADAGTKKLLTTPVSPLEPSDRIVRSLEKVYRAGNIEFSNHIDPETLVRVDEADLMEIFGNLLENACKYGAQRITLHSSTKNGLAEITIDDDGPGFPEGMHDRLLTRGARADTQIEGQGIGLSISRELIEAHGGTLKLADSESGGARVIIKLPAMK